MFCYNCGNQVNEATVCPFCKTNLPPLKTDLAMKALNFLTVKATGAPTTFLTVTIEDTLTRASALKAEGNLRGAVQAYKTATNNGSLEAAEELLNIYVDDQNKLLPTNDELNILTEKFSDSNSSELLIKLAALNIKSLLRQGVDVSKNKQVLSLLKNAHELGDPVAAYILGEIYFYGNDLSKYIKSTKSVDNAYLVQEEPYSLGNAKPWYKIASDSGIGSATNMLGIMATTGYRSNFAMNALILFEKGASQGSPAAMTNVGITLIAYQPSGGGGDRLTNSYKKAVQYFTMAANAGFTEGMVLLGIVQGSESSENYDVYDPNSAYRWLCTAASAGHTRGAKLKVHMDNGAKSLYREEVDGPEFTQFGYPMVRDVW